jgi:hypothetical protein
MHNPHPIKEGTVSQRRTIGLLSALLDLLILLPDQSGVPDEERKANNDFRWA